MIFRLAGRLAACAAITLLLLGVAGCKENSVVAEKTAANQPEPGMSDPPKLPVVTLAGAKVLQDAGSPTEVVQISATGPFGSNIIPKQDPDRIVVIVHNANIGDAPARVEVNDGTITNLEIAQLNSGKGPAAKITIGLTAKTEHRVVPGESMLSVEVKKPVQK